MGSTGEKMSKEDSAIDGRKSDRKGTETVSKRTDNKTHLVRGRDDIRGWEAQERKCRRKTQQSIAEKVTEKSHTKYACVQITKRTLFEGGMQSGDGKHRRENIEGRLGNRWQKK